MTKLGSTCIIVRRKIHNNKNNNDDVGNRTVNCVYDCWLESKRHFKNKWSLHTFSHLKFYFYPHFQLHEIRIEQMCVVWPLFCRKHASACWFCHHFMKFLVHFLLLFFVVTSVTHLLHMCFFFSCVIVDRYLFFSHNDHSLSVYLCQTDWVHVPC